MKNSSLQTLTQAFLAWIPLAVAIICLSGLTFASFQQFIRISADNSIHETALNLVNVIETGVSYDQLQSTSPVDITKDNSFIYMVYDKDKNVVASNVKDMDTYKLPAGVLDVAKDQGRNVVTWQPDENIRLAIYVLPFTGDNEGYVVSARTLYASESNTKQLLKVNVAGLALTLAVTLVSYIVIAGVKEKVSKNMMAKVAVKDNAESKMETESKSLEKKVAKPEIKSEEKTTKKVSKSESKSEPKSKPKSPKNSLKSNSQN